jgi:anti-sigma regulatory factor (Ser/Thr protein kinase)
METLRLSFRHGEPGGPLRRRVQAALEPWCPADVVADVLVVVSELVQNVTQHTSDGGDFRLRRTGDAVVIEVADRSGTLPRRQPPDGRREGGRGLLIVAGVARAWGVRPEKLGKVVWAEIDVPTAAAFAA